MFPGKTNMADSGHWTFTVVGMLNNITFHKAKCCAEDLNEADPVKYPTPKITGLLEFEWHLYIEAKKVELKGEMWVFTEKAIVFANDKLIGSPDLFLKLAEDEHNYINFRPIPLYITLADEAYKNYLNSTKHNYVYMDIKIAGQLVGSLLIELFSDVVPKTCENFRALCTGEKGESAVTEFRLNYEGALFHRIVKNGWIQGGDIWMKKGDGGQSIYGAVFEDENFAMRHSRRGILGMANKGRHTNSSQFYITLQPAAWMDTKYVAFGQIIEGTSTLKAMEDIQTVNDRPLQEIEISQCGTAEFKF